MAGCAGVPQRNAGLEVAPRNAFCGPARPCTAVFSNAGLAAQPREVLRRHVWHSMAMPSNAELDARQGMAPRSMASRSNAMQDLERRRVGSRWATCRIASQCRIYLDASWSYVRRRGASQRNAGLTVQRRRAGSGPVWFGKAEQSNAGLEAVSLAVWPRFARPRHAPYSNAGLMVWSRLVTPGSDIRGHAA